VTNHDIGFTAGIETTKVSPQWLQAASQMKKIIVVSQHSKDVFNKTEYEFQDENGQNVMVSNSTPIEVVGFPVRNHEPTIPELELKHDFNFLTIAQWGPRKNLENSIKWFIEEFKDEPVGLILKTNLMKNCVMDRNRIFEMFKNITEEYGETKCSLYLLHGDMTDSEMAGLYRHPKIKAYVSLSHGEGFGLPGFDAVCSGMPVITCAWSGQMDYLTAPKDKKGNRRKGYFSKVDFNLAPIQKEAVWPGVLQKDSMWCYPRPGSAKNKMRRMYKDYQKHVGQANFLKKHILKEFTEEKMYEKFVTALDLEDIVSTSTSEDDFQEVIVL
jgi:hypothetical protein